MLVSIVITSYNSEKYIKDAINSCLNQNYKDVEVIVIDGFSKDGTVGILKRFGSIIKYISEPDSGETEAMQKGLKVARGEIIGFLNSDDLLTPNSLSEVVSNFNSEPEVEFVFGNAAYCDENGELVGKIKNLSRVSYDYILNNNPDLVSQPAGFFARSMLLRIGGWNQSVNLVNDLELWLRVLHESKYKYCNSVFCIIRRHPMQQSVRKNKQLHYESIIIRKKMGGHLFCRANFKILEFYTIGKFKKIIKRLFFINSNRRIIFN